MSSVYNNPHADGCEDAFFSLLIAGEGLVDSQGMLESIDRVVHTVRFFGGL